MLPQLPASRQLQVLSQIGTGSFGAVYVVRSQRSRRLYALKEIGIDQPESGRSTDALNEVDILRILRHRHIVRYREAFRSDRSLYIRTEYCPNGDMNRYLKQHGPVCEGRWGGRSVAGRKTNTQPLPLQVDEPQALDWTAQLLLALRYLHGAGILHRDLKTQNIFLDARLQVKLGDFGISKLLDNDHQQAHTLVGTPYYLSPVCFRGGLVRFHFRQPSLASDNPSPTSPRAGGVREQALQLLLGHVGAGHSGL